MSKNLKKLKKTTPFQWSIIAYMNIINLNDHDLTTLRRQFEALDSNRDGTLSLEEI
jgi:hypothetical protein